jgi:hypothetical protein
LAHLLLQQVEVVEVDGLQMLVVMEALAVVLVRVQQHLVEQVWQDKVLPVLLV